MHVPRSAILKQYFLSCLANLEIVYPVSLVVMVVRGRGKGEGCGRWLGQDFFFIFFNCLSDMPFVTNFTQIWFQNILFTQKTRTSQQTLFCNKQKKRLNYVFTKWIFMINIYDHMYSSRTKERAPPASDSVKILTNFKYL